MFYKPILLPLLAQVLLTFVVWVYLYVLRVKELRAARIDPQQLSSRAAAQQLLKTSAGPSDNLKNLFEMPVLFYAAALLSLVLLIQDSQLVVLAWAYVALRAVHSFIHCTYNRVMHRFLVYVGSCIILAFIWLRLAAWILTQ